MTPSFHHGRRVRKLAVRVILALLLVPSLGAMPLHATDQTSPEERRRQGWLGVREYTGTVGNVQTGWVGHKGSDKFDWASHLEGVGRALLVGRKMKTEIPFLASVIWTLFRQDFGAGILSGSAPFYKLTGMLRRLPQVFGKSQTPKDKGRASQRRIVLTLGSTSVY